MFLRLLYAFYVLKSSRMAMYDCFPYSLIEDSGKDVTTKCCDIRI